MLISLVGLLTQSVQADVRLISDPPSVIHQAPYVAFTVGVRIQGTAPHERVKSFELILDYDMNKLEMLNIQEGELFANSGYSTFWYFYEDEVEMGQIHVVDAILGHGLDVEASGTLFTMTFKGLVKDTTTLTFNTVKIGVLNEDKSQVIYVPDPQAEPIEIALPVVVSGLAALVSHAGVHLKWQLQSGQGMLGFILYRIDQRSDIPVRLNADLIPVKPSESSPHEYQFLDDSVDLGKTYQYFVESLNIAGKYDRSETITVRIRPQGTMWAQVKRSMLR